MSEPEDKSSEEEISVEDFLAELPPHPNSGPGPGISMDHLSEKERLEFRLLTESMKRLIKEKGVSEQEAAEIVNRALRGIEDYCAAQVASGVPPGAVYRQLRDKAIEQSGEIPRSTTKQEYAKCGAKSWPHSYGKSKDDLVAGRLLVEFACSHGAGANLTMHAPQEQLVLCLSAKWYDQGLPQIVMGHKYAASLLSTRISKNSASMIVPPWGAFWIEVPNDLIYIADTYRNDVAAPVTGLLVGFSKAWNFVTYSAGTPNMLFEMSCPTEDLLEEETFFREGLSLTDGYSIKPSNIDDRAGILIRRLIANVCIASSDPALLREHQRGGPRGKSKRTTDEPLYRTYSLGATPVVDCREAVREFALGKRRSSVPLSVQVLVCGHWKRQACGEGRTLRKVIHIEPYWRGPEDAPVLPRTKVLGET